MSRQHISLKSRVRYEGRVKIVDRRSARDAELERLPDPIWRRVNLVLRAKFNKPGVTGSGPRTPGS
jgi:hypothetical protein